MNIFNSTINTIFDENIFFSFFQSKCPRQNTQIHANIGKLFKHNGTLTVVIDFFY
jgi:hypothetical protein